MKPKKTLHDYLPEKKEARLVQAYVDSDLLDAIKKKLDKDGVYLKDLIEAAFRKYLDEAKGA